MTRIIPFLTILIVFMIASASVLADEPTWLFTVPKAEVLPRYEYNLGFVYADFGVNESMELGIRGLKYSAPGSTLAFGLSLFPMASPYVVKSLDAGSGKLHIGLKAAPYVVFAGFEMPISDNINFIAELNNGTFAGVRIFLAPKWTLDIFAGFATGEGYRYRYGRVDIDEFRPIPGIFFAYSDSFR